MLVGVLWFWFFTYSNFHQMPTKCNALGWILKNTEILTEAYSLWGGKYIGRSSKELKEECWCELTHSLSVLEAHRRWFPLQVSCSHNGQTDSYWCFLLQKWRWPQVPDLFEDLKSYYRWERDSVSCEQWNRRPHIRGQLGGICQGVQWLRLCAQINIF